MFTESGVKGGLVVAFGDARIGESGRATDHGGGNTKPGQNVRQRRVGRNGGGYTKPGQNSQKKD